MHNFDLSSAQIREVIDESIRVVVCLRDKERYEEAQRCGYDSWEQMERYENSRRARAMDEIIITM